MSITSRIEEMTTHIGNAYNTLELAGADIYEINKNIINLSPMWKERLLYFINNGTNEVWENWDKEEDNGISFTLNQTVKAPMKIQYWGNTYQETTTGKNIFDLDKVIYWDNCIKLETGMKFQNLWSGQIVNSTNVNALFEPNTTYTCKVKTKITSKPSTVKETQVPIALYRRSSESLSYLFTPVVSAIANNPLNTEIEKITTFTTPDDLTEVVLLGYCWYGNNDGSTTYSGTGTIEFNDFIIVKGTYTAVNFPSYEPYTGGIASPNPNYPQDIHVVSGDNSIEVCGKNFLDNSKIVKGRLDNGVVGYESNTTALTTTDNSISFTTNTGWRGITTGFIKRKSGSFVIIQNTSDNSGLNANIIAFYDKDKNWLGNKATTIQDYGWRSFNDVDNAEYIRIAFLLSSAGSCTMTNTMVEFGTEPSTYEEYKSASYPINLPVENLYNKDNDNHLVAYIPQSGTISYGANNYFVWVKINKNTKYSIKFTQVALSTSSVADNIQIGLYENEPALNVTGTRIYTETRTSATQDYTYTYTFNSENNSYVGIKVAENTKTNVTDTLATLQISVGEPTSKYYPYGTTPIELCKIGTYQDKIFKNTPNTTDYDSNLEDNVWYLKKEIGKYTFTGNENWVTHSYGTNSWALQLLSTVYNANKLQIISNIFKGIPASERSDDQTNIMYFTNDTIIVARNTTFTAKADIQSATSGNYAYYVLATPIYEPITDTTLISQLEAMKQSYESVTNISQINNDLPFELNITALKEMDDEWEE